MTLSTTQSNTSIRFIGTIRPEDLQDILPQEQLESSIHVSQKKKKKASKQDRKDIMTYLSNHDPESHPEELAPRPPRYDSGYHGPE